MSRLNTLYPNDTFLKNISNVMGKVDSKNETQIKQEIEQIGYKEFYRYYNEKNVYIKQLQQENQQLKIQISAREEECRKLEDDWNKLKKYINKTKINEFEKSFGKRYGKTFTQAEIIVCNMIKNKMQELERGVSDVED